MNALSCRVAVVVFVVVDGRRWEQATRESTRQGLSRGGSILRGGDWQSLKDFFEPFLFLFARMLTSSARTVSRCLDPAGLRGFRGPHSMKRLVRRSLGWSIGSAALAGLSRARRIGFIVPICPPPSFHAILHLRTLRWSR